MLLLDGLQRFRNVWSHTYTLKDRRSTEWSIRFRFRPYLGNPHRARASQGVPKHVYMYGLICFKTILDSVSLPRLLAGIKLHALLNSAILDQNLCPEWTPKGYHWGTDFLQKTPMVEYPEHLHRCLHCLEFIFYLFQQFCEFINIAWRSVLFRCAKPCLIFSVCAFLCQMCSPCAFALGLRC